MAEEVVVPKFKIGDFVKLKSGGAQMTVASLRKEVNPETLELDLFYGFIFCNWFEEGKLQTRQFHQDMFDLVVKD